MLWPSILLQAYPRHSHWSRRPSICTPGFRATALVASSLMSFQLEILPDPTRFLVLTGGCCRGARTAAPDTAYRNSMRIDPAAVCCERREAFIPEQIDAQLTSLARGPP